MKRILIANRGEIAVRIQCAAQKLGINTVSVASTADAAGYHARTAEKLVIIGPPPPAESYLNIPKLLLAAQDTGCDAVHPGYGFLSENAGFARAVIEAGLIFIGPTPESIDILGSKTAARAQVQKFGVPCTPGAPGDLDDAGLIAAAKTIGFPVIIKAVAGGGGRGMRVANSAEEMTAALPRARAEALKNFASASVYIEKYISEPRHVEVQVFGDSQGNVVHFGTRDCSSQRRHQKLIEEAPAPFLAENTRSAIEAAAVQAARSVGYKNAGTAEFLVAGDAFYFLEMNTRIQVEHPVTELVTGVDLVELQLRVARGEKLPFTQAEITTKGHAIEFRIYAEDPARNFAPILGTLGKLNRPSAPFVREDFGYEEGDTVSPYYDAMLSKFIVSAPSRAEAIVRAEALLAEYKITGLTNNVLFHRWMLAQPTFRQHGIDIGFIEREFSVEKLGQFAARVKRDPAHKPSVAGCEPVELLRYQHPATGERCYIELIHRRDGLFLAQPRQDVCAGLGSRTDCRFSRLSNGREQVVQILIREVLECQNWGTIFVIPTTPQH